MLCLPTAHCCKTKGKAKIFTSHNTQLHYSWILHASMHKADQADERRILMALVSRAKLLLSAEISQKANSVASKVKNCSWPQGAEVREGQFCPWPEIVLGHRTKIHTWQIEQTFQCTKTSLPAACFSLLCTSPFHGKRTPLSARDLKKKHLNFLYKQCMPGNCRTGRCRKGKCI